MRGTDVLLYCVNSLRGHPARSLLTIGAMAIGVAAVIVLTALGEGARRYVTGEFTSLGTHLLIILPGRSETTGAHPPILGETPRDLTLDDAIALLRSRYVRRVAPVVLGSVPVSWQRREREVTVVGSTLELLYVRHLKMAQGKFLPEMDARAASPIVVVGRKVRQELFGPEQALGQWMQIGNRRYRIIGILASRGHSIGLDLDEVVIIPVASAQALFDSPSLFRILAEAKTREDVPRAAQEIRRIIRDRHEGEDDVTVITQDAVMVAFERIFRALTLTVAGIAAISLLVAGLLIMNVLLISVSQRTPEIGLLKALGTLSSEVLLLFLSESTLLSLGGILCGMVLAAAALWTGRQLFPVLPLSVPVWAVWAALITALGSGLVFGVLPARRASRLDPVQALSRK